LFAGIHLGLLAKWVKKIITVSGSCSVCDKITNALAIIDSLRDKSLEIPEVEKALWT